MSGDPTKDWRYDENLGTITKHRWALDVLPSHWINISDDSYWHALGEKKRQDDFEEASNYFGE